MYPDETEIKYDSDEIFFYEEPNSHEKKSCFERNHVKILLTFLISGYIGLISYYLLKFKFKLIK